MSLLENLTIIAYLGLLAWLGLLGWRRTRTSADYLLAGRNAHPFVMAMSYGATFISTAAIVGFGGVAAWLGNSMLWLVFLNIFVGVFIAFVVLGRPTRRMGHRLDAHTFPELLGKRFDSRFIQVAGGVLILGFMPLYAAAVLIGGTRFVAAYFHVDYHLALLVFSVIITAYVLAGGLKSVMLTDALQGSIMVVAMLVLGWYTFDSLGGFSQAYATLREAWEATVAGPLAAVDLASLPANSPDALMKQSLLLGFQGWGQMPVTGSPGWLFLVTTLVLGVGIGVLAQPQLIVRFMTVKSQRELNRSVLIGGLFILILTGVIYLVGTLTNAWFYLHDGGRNALQAAGGIAQVIPHYINSAMPRWFGFLFLFALISAAMSTLSSQFHTMGTAVGRDVYERLTGAQHDTLGVTRIGVVVMILVSVALAYAFDREPAIIARSTALFFALCASIFLPTYLGALFWRRMTTTGAIASMVTGFLISGFWLLFVHFKEAKALGLARALFGTDSLLSGKVIFVDALVIALPLSALVAVVVSLLTRPLPETHLQRCYG